MNESAYDAAGKSILNPCELGWLPLFDEPVTVSVGDEMPCVPLPEYYRRINAHHGMIEERDSEIAALRAKNARLREALENAVGKWDYTNDGMRQKEGAAEYEKARLALKENEP